jgi:hypothetical protein
MKLSLVIASDFAGLIEWLTGISIALLLCAFVSFVPARRGHWSAPLLAAPVILFGGSLFWSVLKSGPVPFLSILVFGSPLLCGSISLVLWILTRFSPDESRKPNEEEATNRPSQRR